MSNRVTLDVSVSDRSSAGLASLRRSLRQAQRQARAAGTDIRFNVVIPAGATRREIRRIRRALQNEPVNIRPQIDPPIPSVVTTRRRIARTLGAPIRVPVRLATRGMVSGTRGPLRALGGLVSGTLQDGVGQGIIMGFKSGGPVGIAFLGTLILGLASVVGAALSGLLVTALGAAFVGIGGVSAAMSKQIKSQWSDTLEVLKEEFAEVGEPLIPVLDRALERLERMAEAAGPKLRKAIEETAPATEKFINSIMDGFESFAGEAFDPIMDAWNVFAPVFGEQWDEFMRELGDAFGDMADLVREHPTEIAAALEVIFETLELLVRTVTFFGKMWVLAMQTIGDSIGFVLGALSALVDGFLEGIDFMLAGLQSLGGLIGLSGPVKEARRNLEELRESAVGKLEEMAISAYGWDDALNQANRKRQLEADIATWQEKLEIARNDLKRTTGQKARAKVEANIADLTAKLKTARSELATINGKTATTYVNTVYTSQGFSMGGDGTRGGRLAHGGVVGSRIGRAASGGVRSNMTLVGENGPEIVNLPTGAHVNSNPNTRQMLAGGGGGGGGIGTLEIVSDDAFMIEWLRRIVRNRGGDFDIVFRKGRTA